MKETIDLFGKILTNILTALYEPFGFLLLLSFLAMFFYLYAYEPTAAGKGWKSAIVTWYQKFKESVFFRKMFLLVFVIDYVRHLYSKRLFIGVTDEEIYDRIIDFIQIAGAKSIIDEKWSEVLKADDGSRTFIELFDDIFTNAIEKYEAEFIHSLVDTDVIYRMVTETICNENRFIPWPNKVQNRWNPPKKHICISLTERKI